MSEYEVFLLSQIVTELFKSSIPATSKPYMNFSKLDTMDLNWKLIQKYHYKKKLEILYIFYFMMGRFVSIFVWWYLPRHSCEKPYMNFSKLDTMDLNWKLIQKYLIPLALCQRDKSYIITWGVLDTTLCDKVCQCLWFFQGTLVSIFFSFLNEQGWISFYTTTKSLLCYVSVICCRPSVNSGFC
jgi:hypothetical protein